jgi:hypothetical protein
LTITVAETEEPVTATTFSLHNANGAPNGGVNPARVEGWRCSTFYFDDRLRSLIFHNRLGESLSFRRQSEPEQAARPDPISMLAIVPARQPAERVSAWPE